VVNPGANIDIFAGLAVSPRCRANENESEDDEKNPESHSISAG